MSVSFLINSILVPFLVAIVTTGIFWYMRPTKASSLSFSVKELDEIRGWLSRGDMKMSFIVDRLDAILKCMRDAVASLKAPAPMDLTAEAKREIRDEMIKEAESLRSAFNKAQAEERSIAAALAKSDAFDVDLFGDNEEYRESLMSELRQSKLLKDRVKKKRRGRPPKKKV